MSNCIVCGFPISDAEARIAKVVGMIGTADSASAAPPCGTLPDGGWECSCGKCGEPPRQSSDRCEHGTKSLCPLCSELR